MAVRRCLSPISEFPFLLLLIVGSAAAAQGQTLSACDVNQDGSTNVADIQFLVKEALGEGPANGDLNNDGVGNVADVEIVIDAVMERGCAADGAVPYTLTAER